MGGVTDQISAQFNNLGNSSNNPQTIRSDPSLQTLLQTIQNSSMDAMMLPDQQVAQEDPYKNMALNETLRKFFVSSGACADFDWQGQSTFGHLFWSTSHACDHSELVIISTVGGSMWCPCP